MKFHTCKVLHQRCISIEIIIGEKQYSLWWQHKKNTIFHSNYSWWSCSFFISSVITGVQMGEISKLGWLICWSSRDMWADSLYFLYVVLGSICKTLASFQYILWSSSYACCVLKDKQDDFEIKTRQWTMSKNVIFVLMYHRQNLSIKKCCGS
jgi:hypothetical protein